MHQGIKTYSYRRLIYVHSKSSQEVALFKAGTDEASGHALMRKAWVGSTVSVKHQTDPPVHSTRHRQQVPTLHMSASAERRGITRQVVAAWGRAQESTVAACPTWQHVVFDSVVHRRQRFECNTTIVIQSIVLGSSQQVADSMLSNSSRNCMFSPPPLSRGDPMWLTGRQSPRAD